MPGHKQNLREKELSDALTQEERSPAIPALSPWHHQIFDKDRNKPMGSER